jgi:hypothetical protein
MSALPERYQRYTMPAGQPTVRHGEIELAAERDPIVWVEDAYGQSVAMRRSQLPTTERTEPRNLEPQPLFDPTAQKLLCGGVGIGAAGAGLGYGMGQMFAGIALMGTSGLAILVGLLLAAGMRGRGSVHVHQEVHNHNRWFGRSTTSL